jgi:2'-5' RNA ligase
MVGLRAFLAIEPGPEARRAAAVVAQRLAASLPGVRWVRPEGYHVTLRFLGRVEPAALPPLVAAARAALAGVAPFELHLGAVGLFPSPRRPRAVALVLAPEAPLVDLAARVEGAVRTAGFPAETRPFHAHLTLGRPRLAAPRAPLEGGPLPAADFAVREVVLFRSELRPEGARYTPLERLPLGGCVSPASTTTSEGEDHGTK